MTFPELRQRIISGAVGGSMSADVRFDFGYIDSLINSARATLIKELFKEIGVVPPVYYQPYFPDYVEDMQDSANYSTFYMPDLIPLDGTSDGGGFVGSITCHQQFNQVNNRSEFADMQRDRIMKAGRRAVVLITKGRMEVHYKNKIKEFRMEIIAADPLEVPSFNLNYDEYPIDANSLSRLDDFIMKIHLDRAQNAVSDRIANNRDDSSRPFKPQQ